MLWRWLLPWGCVSSLAFFQGCNGWADGIGEMAPIIFLSDFSSIISENHLSQKMIPSEPSEFHNAIHNQTTQQYTQNYQYSKRCPANAPPSPVPNLSQTLQVVSYILTRNPISLHLHCHRQPVTPNKSP